MFLLLPYCIIVHCLTIRYLNSQCLLYCFDDLPFAVLYLLTRVHCCGSQFVYVVVLYCFQFNPSPDSAVSHSKFYALEVNGHCSPIIDHCIVHSSSIGQIYQLLYINFVLYIKIEIVPYLLQALVLQRIEVSTV